MPEGHTVHRIAELFRDHFVGHSLEASSPQGRFREGAALISGSHLERSAARGKQLFLHFEAERVVRVHLGIYGAWGCHHPPGSERPRGLGPNTVPGCSSRCKTKTGRNRISPRC